MLTVPSLHRTTEGSQLLNVGTALPRRDGSTHKHPTNKHVKSSPGSDSCSEVCFPVMASALILETRYVHESIGLPEHPNKMHLGNQKRRQAGNQLHGAGRTRRYCHEHTNVLAFVWCRPRVRCHRIKLCRSKIMGLKFSAFSTLCHSGSMQCGS